MSEQKSLTKVQAIMRYFSDPEGKRGIPSDKPSLAEMKALSREDRDELAMLAAVELGVDIAVSP